MAIEPGSVIGPHYTQRQANGDRPADVLNKFGEGRFLAEYGVQDGVDHHPGCCDNGDNPAQGKQVENAKAQGRAHFSAIGQGVLDEPPRVYPDWGPDHEQGQPIDRDLASHGSKHIARNVKQETQDLLCAEHGQQQAVQHPDIAVQPADIGIIFGIGQFQPVTAQNCPEIGSDDPVHPDRNQVVSQGLLAEGAKGASHLQARGLDQGTVNKRQNVLGHRNKCSQQDCV